MKFLIMGAVMALGLSGITVTAKRKMEPRIVAEHKGRNCCESRDGLIPPCIAGMYTIENPVMSPVSVTMQCNPELIGPVFEIPARSRQEVEVCPEIPVDVHCFILTWSKKE